MKNMKFEDKINKKKTFYDFIINNLLLLSGIIMILSGLTLQQGYHRPGPDGPHGFGIDAHASHQNIIKGNSFQYERLRGIDTVKTIWGLRYAGWARVHKSAIVFFSLFMLYHICAHLKWYKGVVARHLISKNIQITTLSITFLIVALTGLIP